MASLFGRFFGRTVSEGAAFAAGVALGPVLAPVVRQLENDTWAAYPVKPPAAVTLAVGVAQGQVKEADARQWAKETGYGDDAFTALINVANTGPGVAVAFDLWRRKQTNEAGFRRAAKRQGLEQEWIDDLVALKDNVLEPAEIAKAVHRGIMRNDGLLVAVPPSTPGKVPAVPPSPLDPILEAEGSGMTEERLRIITGNAGLPPGIVQMLQLMNRGEITKDDFLRGVGESNLRNEWGPVMLNLARQLLTATEYVDAHLRGYIGPDEMHAGTALHGMTPEDTDLLFKTHGRPITVHQLVTGEARGGTYDGPTGNIPPEFIAALKESSIKPPYYNLAYANRYSYPSAFVLRSLAQAGDLGDAPAVAKLLEQIGWPPSLATQVSVKWVATGTATDPNVKKAQTQLWTTTHTSYKAQEIDDAAAVGAFNLLGIPATAQTEIFTLWQYERGLRRAQLSPADVRKAWQQGDINDATGAAWTQDEARAALIDRGWSVEQANDYLNIPYKG